MEIFSSAVVRRALFAMMAVCVVMEGIFTGYEMTADGISYLDLSDLIARHQWHWVVNAYWHPGYPALLLLGRTVLRSSLWNELTAVRCVNVAIAGGLFLAVRFALRVAVELRESFGFDRVEGALVPLRRETVGVFAAGITLLSVTRELGVGAVRPDVLLAMLLVFGAGFLMRVGARKNLLSYAGLGFCFGLAFLVKSVAFPTFAIALLLLPFVAGSMKKAAKGFAVAVLIFAALAGPYIGALSKQKGRFSAGDSGGLNYAWYVDGADRFEQQKNEPSRYGLAKGELKHTSVQVLQDPAIYYYGTVMPGSEAQWLDPSYWNDGLKPRFNVKAEARTMRYGLTIVVQYFVLRLQYVLLVLVLLMMGGRWRREEFGWRGAGPVLLLLAAGVGMYVVVYTEARYIASAAVLALIVLVAFVRIPKGWQGAAALGAFVFSGMVVCSSFTESMRDIKQNKNAEGRAVGAYNRAIFTAGEGLGSAAGIQPGDTVACLGEAACRDDFYWARLAQVHVRTEMYVESEPISEVWDRADKERVMAALRSTGAKALVAKFGANVTPPSGWTRLGAGDFFVIYL
jgi:hypothetical protein